jgi:hypothetical protein
MASTENRTGPRIARLAAVGMIAALALVVTPGTAAAAGEITPVLNCVKRVSGDADWTAFLGYTNSSSRMVTYQRGPDNGVRPSPQDGRQPTDFLPGTHSGVFTITMNARETAVWTVSGRSVTITRDGPACPPSTELPAEGNEAGTAMALVAAGLIGAVVLVRCRRRLDRSADRTASAGLV